MKTKKQPSGSKKVLLSGVVWNALGSTMYGANSFVMLALVSREGTVEQAGAFGIAFTTAQILYIVGLFGVPHIQMTDYNEKYSFTQYALLRAASCGLMLFSCLLVIVFLGFSGEKLIYTLLLTVLMLLNVVGELFQSMFFQNDRLDLSGSALFYRTLWSLLVFIFVIISTKNVYLALITQILCNLLVTLYYAFHTAPTFIKKAERTANRANAGTLALDCLPLFFSLILMNLLINAPKYGIEFFSDDTTQGYFNMIFMPVQVIDLCSQFIFKPLLSRFALLVAEKNSKAFYSLLIKQLLLVGGFTLLCCAASAVFGVPVLGIVYNKDLSGLGTPLTLLVLGGGVYALCQMFYYILVTMRAQGKILLIYVIASIVAAAFTPWLVTQWGMMGAVTDFAIIHIFILIGYSILIFKNFNH